MTISVLVTGGAGYIGSHVCKAMSKTNFKPVVYDNLVTGNRHAAKWGEFVEGDIRDFEKLTATIKEHNIQAIIHLAAYIAVGESVEDPGKYYDNNSFGGLNLLNAMKATNLDKIVFSSTAAVYGTPKTVPIVENDEKLPINPYGFSKLIMEQMLQDYQRAYGIRSTALRYFNVAGADPESEIGCAHQKPNNLIPILMNVASGKQESLHIYGTDYKTPDGTAIRDYIHVSDLADAHIKSLEYLFDNGKSDVFNLGTGKGTSVSEVVSSVNKVTGLNVNTKNVDRRAGDPDTLYANSNKAKDILQWEAKFTNIDEITKSAWNWQQTIMKRQ